MTCSCFVKSLMTVFVACGALLSANAQKADGRNFGIDGFAAVSGTPGTPHYLEGGTTGGAGGKVCMQIRSSSSRHISRPKTHTW